MTSNNKSLKSRVIINSILLLVVIVLINFISVRMFTRLDCTENQRYSLSDASKKIINDAEDRMTVKVYFTEDLPVVYNNNRRYLIDILNDFKAYSDGNLRYEFISPEDSLTIREAKENGIPLLEVQSVENDKLEVLPAYMGLVIAYEDRKERIPIIESTDNLEYELAAAFKRVMRSEKIKVCYSLGQGETDLEEHKTLFQILKTNYNMISIDLTEEVRIPERYEALLIVDPKEEFADQAKYAIDQYIMKGGKVAFLTGKAKYDPTFKNKEAEILNLGLDEMLAHYGIVINNDVVRDKQCGPITVVKEQEGHSIKTLVSYPFIPSVYDISRENPIVKQLRTLILKFPSSVDTSLAEAAGIKSSVLFRASNICESASGTFSIDPLHKFSDSDYTKNGLLLAASFEGKFKSWFLDKDPASNIDISPETRIVAVGTGGFATDNFARNPDNIALFANIVDYLADDTGLISIRSKNVSMPPLDELQPGTKKLVKFSNMLFAPILVVLIGLLVWRRRASRKRKFEEELNRKSEPEITIGKE